MHGPIFLKYNHRSSHITTEKCKAGITIEFFTLNLVFLGVNIAYCTFAIINFLSS